MNGLYSEDAVEHDELDRFLRLKESWDPDRDQDYRAIEVKPVGVPGVALPLQMTPDHIRTKILAQHKSLATGGMDKKQVPANKRTGEFDVGTELQGYGLQGVHATKKELEDLIKELGLEGDDAGDLVKGLAGESFSKVEVEEKEVTQEIGGATTADGKD